MTIDLRNAVGQRFSPTPVVIPGARHIVGEFTMVKADEEIAVLEANPHIDLTYYVQTRGGDHEAAIKLSRAMKKHKGKITTIAGEYCSSAGMTVLCSGNVVKAFTDASLLIHEAKIGLRRDRFVSTAQLAELSEEIERANHQQLSVYKDKSNMSVSSLKRLMALDAPLTAQQAKDFKLVDVVLSSKSPRLPEKPAPTEALKNLIGSFSAEGQRHCAEKLGLE